ncbi:MAG: 4-hydroxy-tetrahydrodipicolinate reductase [Alphaproteobacteria bacterium]|nr:4-hydroxy-tetrahydrodipicolinate reductase [Alphaproteobacteria bacterium]
MKKRIAIIGAAGRMGLSLVRQIVTRTTTMELVAAVDRPEQQRIGSDIGLMAGLGEIGLRLTDSVTAAYNEAQVVIDFSSAEATYHHLRTAVMAEVPMVIGTTGFNDHQYQAIQSSAEQIPILIASNFSLGVVIAEALVEKTASLLGEEWDIEISEMHHRDKLDAPSGTALSLGEAAARGRGRKLSDLAVRGRDGFTGIRKTGTIGFSALRGGDVVGDHQVIFAGAGEILSISHKASNRDIFAQGAVMAAEWLVSQRPGLYSLRNMLGL